MEGYIQISNAEDKEVVLRVEIIMVRITKCGYIAMINQYLQSITHIHFDVLFINEIL